MDKNFERAIRSVRLGDACCINEQKPKVKVSNVAGYAVTDSDPHYNAIMVTDYGCAAALLLAGYELVAIDTKSASRVAFFFSGYTEAIIADIDAYWDNRMTVSSHKYWHSVKSLTALLLNHIDESA